MDRSRESGSSTGRNGASSARRESEDSIGENGAPSARRESVDSIGENGAPSARRESEGSIGGNGAPSVTRNVSPVAKFLNGQSAPDVPSEELPPPKTPSPQHSASSTSSDSAIVMSARSPHHEPPLSPIVIIINEMQPSTSRAAVEADFRRRTEMSDQDRLREKRDSEFVEPDPFSVAAGLLSNLRFLACACPEPRVQEMVVDMRRVNSDGEFEEHEDQISHDGVRAQLAFKRDTATVNKSLYCIIVVIAIVALSGVAGSIYAFVKPSNDKPSDSSRYPDAHQ